MHYLSVILQKPVYFYNSWSIGSHISLWKFHRFALRIEGQYFSSNPHAKVLFIRANVDEFPGSRSRRNYEEWQIGVGISYLYNAYFMLYAAIKYAHAFWAFDEQFFLVTNTLATIPSLRSSKNWGYAVGLTLQASFQYEKIEITIEGRFADETALYINGQILF